MNVYEQVAAFYRAFRGEKRIIGESAFGRDLFAFFIGSHDGAPLLSQAAIHGREWITGLIALTHVRRGLAHGGAWVIPLMNPDGALLSETGLSSAPVNAQDLLITVNGGTDFSLWKANGNAVDLNVNFPARWGTGAANVFSPSPENYVGESPLSEPESHALAAFTLEVAPKATVSWHTKGGEIYWEFYQRGARKRRDRKLAEVLSKSTKYPLSSAPNSAGGYKDWCVETLKIPAFTVEAARTGVHPIGRDALGGLLGETSEALFDLSAAMG